MTTELRFIRSFNYARAMALSILCVVIILFSTFFSLSAQAQSESLGRVKERLGINADKAQISVSGVSAGGWLAVQYHIAHSKQIMGAGILAAGPYHCAGSKSVLCRYTPYALFNPHDSCQAMYVCSKTAAQSFFGFYLGPPDHAESIASTVREAERGAIDALSGLKGDRVWIFTGGREDILPHDRLVPHGVVKELREYYRELFARPDVLNDKGNIKFVDSVQVDHSMVTDSPEVDVCSRFGGSYINDCSYPAASNLLDFLYPQRPKVRNSGATGSLDAFDQSFASKAPNNSMHSRGHIYLPKSCRNGTKCPLHVALHGCLQDEKTVEQLPELERLFFFRDGGYNEWAEQHGVIILYPQAAKSSSSPYGCWDWWGYSGPDYYVKSGKQIEAIHTMVECLTGDAVCP